MFKSVNMRRLATATAVAAVLMTMALPALAAGDESDERRMQAQSLFDQGQKLAESDPKAALGAYRSSYEIHADFRVLYNIGKICGRLGDRGCAARSFEQYLKDGGSEVPTKRRKEVEAELKSISSKNPASLAIKSSITGAYVKVDGVVVGRTPLAQPIAVTAGTHKVVLVADGNVVEKSVLVTAGATENVELEMKKEEAPPAPTPVPVVVAPAPVAPPPPPPAAPAASNANAKPAPEPAPRASAEGRRGFPVLPWIVTGTLAAGTAVSAVLTSRAYSDYNAKRDAYPITRDELDAAHGKGRDLLMLTGVLGSATLVSLGVAGYFTLTRGPAPTADKTVGIAVGPGGVSISGRLP